MFSIFRLLAVALCINLSIVSSANLRRRLQAGTGCGVETMAPVVQPTAATAPPGAPGTYPTTSVATAAPATSTAVQTTAAPAPVAPETYPTTTAPGTAVTPTAVQPTATTAAPGVQPTAAPVVTPAPTTAAAELFCPPGHGGHNHDDCPDLPNA